VRHLAEKHAGGDPEDEADQDPLGQPWAEPPALDLVGTGFEGSGQCDASCNRFRDAGAERGMIASRNGCAPS